MGNRVNLLTILVLTVSTLSLLFLDDGSFLGTKMTVILALSLSVRIGLVALLFYAIIKYIKMSNMQQLQSGSTNQPKYNIKMVSFIMFGICMVGFIVGLIAGLL